MTWLLTVLGSAAITGIMVAVGLITIFLLWIGVIVKKDSQKDADKSIIDLSLEIQQVTFKLNRLEEYLGIKEIEQPYKKYYTKGKKS